MEISAETVNVLRNFSGINGNLIIKPGNVLMTISEAKNILAEATVEETFDSVVGIYDLTEFLNMLGLVDKPSVKFEQGFMSLASNSGREHIKYFYADTEMLTSPTKPIVMPSADVWFTLDQSTLGGIKKAASIFGHTQMIIEPDNGAIRLSVNDPENKTSNTYSVVVDGGYDDSTFNFVLNISNLKMVSEDYQVKISSKLISEFTNSDETLKYWVALEKTSSYGE
tara:strand:+ start:2333 stop:3007 length:675 start_codon:yes stop_codon:yes gene_type:complete